MPVGDGKDEGDLLYHQNISCDERIKKDCLPVYKGSLAVVKTEYEQVLRSPSCGAEM